MSDPRGHEHEPDRAALEELLRAFADEPETPGRAGVAPGGVRPTVDDHDAGGGHEAVAEDDAVDEHDAVDDVDVDVDDVDVGGDDVGGDDVGGDDVDVDDVDVDLLIVEQEPLDDTGAEPPPTPPIIRIGSIGDPVEAPGAEPVVISIVDEHLPDAVYVEGSLDRGGSETIVIIEDDDTGDTLGPDSERDVRRGIEPRMRERRVAVKRAQGRKRLKWVALVAAVVIVVVGTLAVLGSALFAVRAERVTITGNVYADPAAVQAVIDDLVGTPSLRVDTQRAERELEAIPWVDDARVRVDFPHSASVEIRERQAWSTYQGPDQRFRVLDHEGRVLDLLDGYPIAYVLITGPDPVDLDAGEFAPRGYSAASELAKNLTGSVRTRAVNIEVTADGARLSLFLADGTEVRFGEARDLFAKLVRLETVLTSGEEREPGVIDVSTSEVTVAGVVSGEDGG